MSDKRTYQIIALGLLVLVAIQFFISDRKSERIAQHEGTINLLTDWYLEGVRKNDSLKVMLAADTVTYITSYVIIDRSDITAPLTIEGGQDGVSIIDNAINVNVCADTSHQPYYGGSGIILDRSFNQNIRDVKFKADSVTDIE